MVNTQQSRVEICRLIPEKWFSWDFRVFLFADIVELKFCNWRDKAEFTWHDKKYTVYKKSMVKALFILETEGRILLQAKRDSVFKRQVRFVIDNREYQLTAKSVFGRQFILLCKSKKVGHISPDNMFSRKATINLPLSFATPIQVFIVFLTVIFWRWGHG